MLSVRFDTRSGLGSRVGSDERDYSNDQGLADDDIDDDSPCRSPETAAHFDGCGEIDG